LNVDKLPLSLKLVAVFNGFKNQSIILKNEKHVHNCDLIFCLLSNKSKGIQHTVEINHCWFLRNPRLRRMFCWPQNFFILFEETF
jgi:hypothetical protein